MPRRRWQKHCISLKVDIKAGIIIHWFVDAHLTRYSLRHVSLSQVAVLIIVGEI